jgi:hypothetical protein
MLVPLQSKGRPKFNIKRLFFAIFIVIFSFVLVTIQIFECSGPHSKLNLSVWPPA